MARFRRGDIVELNGQLAAVVGMEGEADVLDEHVALWFGNSRDPSNADSAQQQLRPEVWTVPEQYPVLAQPANHNH